MLVTERAGRPPPIRLDLSRGGIHQARHLARVRREHDRRLDIIHHLQMRRHCVDRIGIGDERYFAGAEPVKDLLLGFRCLAQPGPDRQRRESVQAHQLFQPTRHHFRRALGRNDRVDVFRHRQGHQAGAGPGRRVGAQHRCTGITLGAGNDQQMPVVALVRCPPPRREQRRKIGRGDQLGISLVLGNQGCREPDIDDIDRANVISGGRLEQAAFGQAHGDRVRCAHRHTVNFTGIAVQPGRDIDGDDWPVLVIDPFDDRPHRFADLPAETGPEQAIDDQLDPAVAGQLLERVHQWFGPQWQIHHVDTDHPLEMRRCVPA